MQLVGTLRAFFAVMFDLMKQAYMNEHSLLYSEVLNQGGMVVGALQQLSA